MPILAHETLGGGLTYTGDGSAEPGQLHRTETGSDIPGIGRRTSPDLGLVACFLLSFSVIAFHLYTGLNHPKLGWDDGSITAAFARTWARSGHFALTPVSVTVEGFSSLLWCLLLSIPYFFSSNNDAGLTWMKILSALFAALQMPLIYSIALRQLKNRAAAGVCVLLLAFCISTFSEIKNGMEMNLATFLLLLLFHVLTKDKAQQRVTYACFIIALLLLTRFEMPFMLALLAGGLLIATKRRSPGALASRDLIRIAAFTVFFFLATELWRHHTFHEWMPNTVYAKQQFPYRDWSSPLKFIVNHLRAIDEPFHVLRLVLPVVFLVWLRGVFRKEATCATLVDIHPAITALALGTFLFGALFGKNTGYPGRMVAAMIPFLIIATVGICIRSVSGKRALQVALSLILIANFAMWYRFDIKAPWDDIPVTDIEWLGLGADAIRTALHRDQVKFMMVDVGGSSLCCNQLSVVDIGMLADPTLSHTGYAGFEPYFRQVHPDIVQTHYYWAVDQHVYDLHLLDDYSIVASRGVRFFLRNDLYRELALEHPQSILPVDQVPACLGWYPNDARFSRTKGTCLALNDLDKQRNVDSKPKN